MEIHQLDLLLRLIIAHMLADFAFQTDNMIKGKQLGLRSYHFYLHLAMVGLLTYLFLAQWSNWKAPLMVILLHGAIDLAKININKDKLWLYVADQLVPLFSLVLVWLLITENTIGQLINYRFEWNNQLLIIIIAYLLISLPTGILVGYLTRSWQDDLATLGTDSLKNAGKWIGIIERILILTFILVNQWAPIGFLLAAKSVFRFGDLRESKDQKRTEYILIGTLMSFTMAIIVGISVHWLSS
jgi:hypothetical protein